jgi:hypothetical protein
MRRFSYLFLALAAFAFASCASDSTGPDSGNNNQNIADRQGPDTTGSWQNGLQSGSSSGWKLSSSVDNFFWQSGKLYAFGSFMTNGSGMSLPNMAQIDTGGFVAMPTVTSVGGVTVDYLGGVNSDGNHIHAEMHLSDYHTALAEFDGANWTATMNADHYGVSDFAATSNAAYGWTSGSKVDSAELRKFGAVGMDLLRAWRYYDIRGMVGHGSNLYIARFPSDLFGSPTTYVDVFDGANWTKLADVDGDVNKIKYIGDTLYAMGWINLYKGSCPATRWTGSKWAPVLADDIAYQTEMVDMDKDQNGVYYFATTTKVYRYANDVTTLLGTADGGIKSIAVYKGRLIVSGSFSSMTSKNGSTVISEGIAIFK